MRTKSWKIRINFRFSSAIENSHWVLNNLWAASDESLNFNLTLERSFSQECDVVASPSWSLLYAYHVALH